jgi:16S rRNA (uracil1498-N3)-methyltransferase
MLPRPSLPLSVLRLHVPAALSPGLELNLPDGAARHVQVLRLQPGAPLRLFDGHGGEWQAEVTAMGRRDVAVRIGTHDAIERELPLAVTLALGMPANERMDTLVEKATELGAAALQPLVCERSVLRVDGERAQRKALHWQAIAVAACEQCGRNRVGAVTLLSGPEGGLSEAEEARARDAGFEPVTLGPRVLRADTAPLAALACLGAHA